MGLPIELNTLVDMPKIHGWCSKEKTRVFLLLAAVGLKSDDHVGLSRKPPSAAPLRIALLSAWSTLPPHQPGSYTLASRVAQF